MEIKIFGKKLFEYKNERGVLISDSAMNQIKDSKFIPDFYKTSGSDFYSGELSNYIIQSTGPASAVAVPIKKEDGTTEKKEITPKQVYDLKMLHDSSFKVATDPEYVDAQIAEFKDKLGLIKSEEYDMRNGTEQIASIILRMENRKKYAEVKDFFEQYPYTTTSKITALIKTHNNLQMGQIAQFLADMPKDATAAMKSYNEQTDKLCKKQAVFYIIADKKDFKRTEQRRDPILFAQSPFGHAWQILGAWDKEMLLLEEL